MSFKGTKRVDILDRKDIQDDLWTQYQEALIFLKRHLSVRTEIKGLDRKDSYEIPLEALREAVANAIIHRDYSIRGTSIMVEVHEDRVVIQNPGGFPAGMSRNQLGTLSVRRNELIADIFARMHRSERMGSGFKRIWESMDVEGLPFPKISSDEFFFIEFERPKTFKDEGLNEGLKSLLKTIIAKPGIQAKDLVLALNGRPLKTLERQIQLLTAKKLIERRGSRKTGGYYAV